MILRCIISARLAALVLLLVCFAGVPAQAQSNYLQEVTDMPLPVGFAEDRTAGVAFDKPEGRIVEAAATGPGPGVTVVAFYRNALPELGWSISGRAEALTWQREGETLRIELVETGSQVAIRFHIAPQ